jgi:hypothetical protein
MMVTARRLRSIGWIATLVVCAALVMVLAFRVNALRSQVHQSDLRIIALKQDTMYLETEFETRASQQQLKAWNDVEFGYVAPAATAYLDNERQLAAYSKPVEPDAPAPIRVASADDSVVAAAAFPAMAMTTKTAETPAAQDKPAPAKDDKPKPAKPLGLASLGDHLANVHHATAKPAAKPAKKVAEKKEPAKKAADKKVLAKKSEARKPEPKKPESKKAVAKKTEPKKPDTAKKALAHKTTVERPAAKAIAAHAARPKDHAPAHATRVADAHHRASPVKLALKDAKTVK